jgi:NitT/TauT family transport system substrate-binding protein
MPNRTTRASRSRRARVPVLGLAAALAFTLSGCGLLGGEEDSGGNEGGDSSGGGALEQTDITVGVLPVVDVGPFYLALEKGYFEDEGLNVKAEVLASGPASIQGLESGALDIAFASYPAPIVAQGNGTNDFKIVAEALAAKPGHMALVSMPNSSLRTPQDAPGKKIAITAPNSFTDLAPMAVLESQNVNFREPAIQWVPMKFPDMIPAMQRGDVDGAVVVEPWVTTAQQLLGASVVMDAASGPTAEMPMSGYTALGGEEGFATKAPNAVAAFQRALAKAQAEAQADRAVVEPLLVANKAATAEVAPLMTISTYSTTLDPERVQRVADLLLQFDVLKAPVDVKTMVLQSDES